MEMIFHSHANKTHFHQKGCALMAHFESEGFWNSDVAYSAIFDVVNDPSVFPVFFFFFLLLSLLVMSFTINATFYFFV